MKNKKQLIWIGISLLLFALSYWICRYVAFEIHGTDDGAVIVAIAGGIALILSYIFKWRATTIIAPLGYVAALMLAAIFETDSIAYPGGTEGSVLYSSNLFYIWLISYWVLIGLGIVIDIWVRLKKKKFQ
jgi:hypothetical protein